MFGSVGTGVAGRMDTKPTRDKSSYWDVARDQDLASVLAAKRETIHFESFDSMGA